MTTWYKWLFKVKKENNYNPFSMTSKQSDRITNSVTDSFSRMSLVSETLLLMHVFRKIRNIEHN